MTQIKVYVQNFIRSIAKGMASYELSIYYIIIEVKHIL